MPLISKLCYFLKRKGWPCGYFSLPAKKTSKGSRAESGWAPCVWGSLMVQLQRAHLSMHCLVSPVCPVLGTCRVQHSPVIDCPGIFLGVEMGSNNIGHASRWYGLVLVSELNEVFIPCPLTLALKLYHTGGHNS